MAEEYENVVEFRGQKMVDLGKTFSTKIKAEIGDIITVTIHELIPTGEGDNRKLSFLGATVVDIDKARSKPYIAAQAIDLAQRHRIWQGVKATGIAVSEDVNQMSLAQGQSIPEAPGIHEGGDRIIYRSSEPIGDANDRELIVIKSSSNAYMLRYGKSIATITFFKDDGWTTNRAEAFLSDVLDAPALASKHVLDDEGDERTKFNPFHDESGRFAEAGASKIISSNLTPEYQKEIRG